jgi:hexosaminidase
MIHRLLPLPLVFLFYSCSSPQGPPVSPNDIALASIGIVPRPMSMEWTAGESFQLSPDTPIRWSADAGHATIREAQRLQLRLESSSDWDLPCGSGNPERGTIHLGIDEELGQRLGDEAYRIELMNGQLRLRGASAQGLFYGVQSFLQMLPPNFVGEVTGHTPAAVQFPYEELVIEDAPRFRWRGMHLDVGRYLYAVEDVKGFLDVMAHYKYNVFHWHLTEDQGWRMEIKAFPKLTEVGAFRTSSPKYGERNVSDGTPYGGFYTQEEIKEIVAYAADLHIDVMPEIELPGHSRAAIAAYPELGNPEFNSEVTVSTHWGVHHDTLTPTANTLRFYEQIFDEVIALFPFEYVHIGADEAPKHQWKNSPSAQARMTELGLADEYELQAWFVAHFEKYLAERGRRLVGWDEIQEGGLPAGATMMVWRGWHYGVEAVNKGHDIIMAPTSHTYFDYYQAGPAGEPEAIGGMLGLEKVYSFEPISGELTADQESHVLGAQAQLWSEYFPTWQQVEYMAFPRMLALAEVLWSPRDQRDWAHFQGRMGHQLAHLDARGIQYRIPTPVAQSNTVVFYEEARLPVPTEFDPPLNSLPGKVVYTLDGSEPTAASAQYETDLYFTDSATLRMALVQSSGRISSATTVRLTRLEPVDPGQFSRESLAPGLLRESLSGPQAQRIPDFDAARKAALNSEPGAWTLGSKVVVERVELGDLVSFERFAARFSGFIEIATEGTYLFSLGSDDGSRLRLHGATVIDLDGEHGHLQRKSSVQLKPGTYPFEVAYFEAGGAESLDFSIEGPGGWLLLCDPSQADH